MAKHFRSAPKSFGDELGALPQTPVRGEQLSPAALVLANLVGGSSQRVTKRF
jgi:hypothetical protein